MTVLHECLSWFVLLSALSVLLSLFLDFADPTDEDQVNVLGFQLLAGSRVTLLASKTSREYVDYLKA